MSKAHLTITEAAQSLARAEKIRAASLAYALGGRVAPKSRKAEKLRAEPEPWKSKLDAFDTCSAAEFMTGKRPFPSRPHKQGRKAKRHKHEKKHLSESYYAHICSDKWKAFRHSIIMDRGKKCERCGSKGRIHLHHKTYARFGFELPDDVQLLCPVCHKQADRSRKHRN